MFLWALCYPLITVGLAYAPHLSFATLRAVGAGLFLVVGGVVAGRPWPKGGSTWLLLGVAGIGATTLGFLGMFHAAEFVAPGTATVIASTQPLLAAALAYLVLKERAGSLALAGLVLGFAGVVVMAAFGGGAQARSDGYLQGVAYIVLAAVGVTVSNVVFKYLTNRVDPVMATGIQLLAGSIPLAAVAALTESTQHFVWSPPFLLSLVGLSLPGTALAYWWWFSALKTTPLHKANVFNFLVPVLGIALGVVFYGETITPPTIYGMALAAAGIYAVHRSRERDPAAPKPRRRDGGHPPARLPAGSRGGAWVPSPPFRQGGAGPIAAAGSPKRQPQRIRESGSGERSNGLRGGGA